MQHWCHHAFFYNVLCLRDKSWRFGKNHLKKYNWCGRSFQVRKLSNDNIWSVVIVTKTCFMSQLSFWSSNKYDVMLTENATPVQYFRSLLSCKQKSVVSESTFAIKKKKCGHLSHSYSIWSFVTVLTSVTKDTSYPIPLLPFSFWRRRLVMCSLAFLGSPSVVLDCIRTAKY